MSHETINRELDTLASAKQAAWAAYNDRPTDSARLDAALVASRAYDAWWIGFKRRLLLPMDGQDFHTFGEE